MINTFGFICIIPFINVTSVGNPPVPYDPLNDSINKTNDETDQSVKYNNFDREFREFLFGHGCGDMTSDDINNVSTNLVLKAKNGITSDDTTKITETDCSMNNCESNLNPNVFHSTQPPNNEQNVSLESSLNIAQDNSDLSNSNVNTMNGFIQEGEAIDDFTIINKEEIILHGKKEKDFIQEIKELAKQYDNIGVNSLNRFKERMNKKTKGYFHDFNISNFFISKKDYENLEIIKKMNMFGQKHLTNKIKIDDFLSTRIYDRVNSEIEKDANNKKFTAVTKNTLVIHDMINNHCELVCIILKFLEKSLDEKIIKDFFNAIEMYTKSLKNDISYINGNCRYAVLNFNDPRYTLYRSLILVRSLGTYINISNYINLLLAVMRVEKYNKTKAEVDKRELMNEYKKRNLVEQNPNDEKYYYVINWIDPTSYLEFNKPSNPKRKRKLSE